MKAQIHPAYNPTITVLCSCGNSFVTGSTKESLKVEVCYKCHPLYTGEHRLLDTQGRVEKFQKKQATAQKYLEKHPMGKKKADKGELQTKSLKELLSET